MTCFPLQYTFLVLKNSNPPQSPLSATMTPKAITSAHAAAQALFLPINGQPSDKDLVRLSDAEILEDPYSKKSPLPSIGNFPCLADSPKLSSTWPVKNTTETYHLLQSCKNRSTIEVHNSRECLLAVSLAEVS
jgi:hypothetical protein